jgi:hypothetical protein
LRFLISSSIVCLLGASAFGQQPSVASIVAQFYPTSLIEPGVTGREQCFAVYDADASGSPRTIVAAYTNHSDAVIRVLRANAGRFEVAAEPRGLDASGGQCDVELVDIDANARNEIRVDFSVNRDTASWVFRWDGKQLVNLTPMTGSAASANQQTAFVDGDFIDVDNDGTKEIYVRPRYLQNEPVPPGVLYRLQSERYVEDTRLVGAWTFDRISRTPETSDVQVDLPEGARGPFTLHVVSGRPGGTARAMRPQVWINRRLIVSPANLDKGTVLERTVTLNRANTLEVRFAGQPGEMLIVIKSGRWAP